jgi:hypothetical protein
MSKWMGLFLSSVLFLSLSTNLFSVTNTLIDFNKLKANGDGSKAVDAGDFKSHKATQHMPTIVSYAGVAGSSFSDAEKENMKISLSANNWDVELNSSAASVQNTRYSKTIEWHSKYVPVLKDPSDDVKADGGFTIMGIRVHFPETNFNNWALIKPPFEIPAYDDVSSDNGSLNKGGKFDGYGVLKNVGTIKSIKMRVYGTQFKNSIAILLKDGNNVQTEVHMPQYLDFDGWKELSWSNPNYIDNAANRTLYVVPLYPNSTPYIKLVGFRIYRQGDQIGGDFVTYIRDVKVTYDEAMLIKDYPVDHEAAWGILADRTAEAKKREFSRLGQAQILRFLERQKMDKSTK